MKKNHLSHPVKALALALGLFSSTLFAADAPLKVGTTAAFAIPLEAAVEEAKNKACKSTWWNSATGSPPTSASPQATST